MILLLGGTGETKKIANKLVEVGHKVIVSTATDINLDIGANPEITRISGKLDTRAMKNLVENRNIKAIVDATHPYAVEVSRTAVEVGKLAGIPCFAYVRPSTLNHTDDIIFADDHQHAAKLASGIGEPILLTTGANNLNQYAELANSLNIPLYARVLPEKESIEACINAGIKQEDIITKRGKSTVEENRKIINKYNIGVLVTKDSGVIGGVQEKIEAAIAEKCKIIVVKRPEHPNPKCFHELDKLISKLNAAI